MKHNENWLPAITGGTMRAREGSDLLPPDIM